MIGWFLVQIAAAQSFTMPAPSPHATVSQRVGLADVTVDYSSPGKKDREVWGKLVPYEQIWRTGANAATTLEVSEAFGFGGLDVPAGKYSVFTIPNKDSWLVILNKDVEASTDTYTKDQDAARVEVKTVKGPDRERMTFLFSDTTDTSTRLDLEWDGVRVSVPITVDTPKLMNAQIDAAVADSANTLARAGRYRLEHDDLAGAIALLDDSIAIEESWYNVWLKADALHQKKDHKNAYKLAQRAMELGKAAGDDFFWKDRVEGALAEWKKR